MFKGYFVDITYFDVTIGNEATITIRLNYNDYEPIFKGNDLRSWYKAIEEYNVDSYMTVNDKFSRSKDMLAALYLRLLEVKYMHKSRCDENHKYFMRTIYSQLWIHNKVKLYSQITDLMNELRV